jgi:DNA-directed RNA polymerase subunit RPC12/RpoP
MNDQTPPDASRDNQPETDDTLIEAADAFEAYCVRCREQVAVENPEPVWTSRGQPGTRGTCPNCASTVFRMGRTPAHDKLQAPPPVRVEDAPKLIANRGRKRPQPATYINTGSVDTAVGEQLAKDLESAGVHTWFDPKNATEAIAWAGGVHPALRDCVQMVLVWSKTASESESVRVAWQFFKTARKPITLVLLDTTEIPDVLRRSPRFDFSQVGIDQSKNPKSKSVFRQLVQTLGEQIS